MSDLSAILGDALTLMTPILLAALGGLFTELSGMLNIALEGLIGVGAFGAAVAGAYTHNLAAAAAAGALSGAAVAWAFGASTLRLKANEFISGLAVNLLASGLTVAASARLFGTKGVVKLALPPLPVPMEGDPMGKGLIEQVLLRHDILTWTAWACVPLVSLIVMRTVFGLRLRASGANPKALVSLGKRPERYRLAAIVASGLACGLAGASLTLGIGAYVPNASAGRGWVALVAVYLGGRKPTGILAACLVFALANSLANYAQGYLKVPSDFILAMPYAITLVALVAGALWKRLRDREG